MRGTFGAEKLAELRWGPFLYCLVKYNTTLVVEVVDYFRKCEKQRFHPFGHLLSYYVSKSSYVGPENRISMTEFHVVIGPVRAPNWIVFLKLQICTWITTCCYIRMDAVHSMTFNCCGCCSILTSLKFEDWKSIVFDCLQIANCASATHFNQTSIGLKFDQRMQLGWQTHLPFWAKVQNITIFRTFFEHHFKRIIYR